MKFTDYIKTFDFSISEMINKIMKGLSDEIIELNQVEQLQEGIDAQGQKIKTLKASNGEVYAPLTIAIRKSHNLQTVNVDLKQTGKFYNTFKVVEKEKDFEVKADFEVHENDIRNNFRSEFDFLGLTKDNLEYLSFENILPELEKEIKTKLKL